MSSELVEIQPQILRFTFELKKQSSCTIQLTNKTEHYVAFKVKTTSPKKYCVKPNVGVIKTRGASDFTVVMQAQNTAPPDLLCKDKFLVQTTLVAFGLTDENITSDMFVKGPGKTVLERKLKVILVNPPYPTEPSTLMAVNGAQKPDLSLDTSSKLEKTSGGPENLIPSHKEAEELQPIVKCTEEIKFVKDAEAQAEEVPDGLTISKIVDSKDFRRVDEENAPGSNIDLKVGKEVDDPSLKLNDLASKLVEAEENLVHLTEEKIRAMDEKQMLEHKLMNARLRSHKVLYEELLQELAKTTNVVKRVYVGYPFLYVCMVGICSLTFGYLVHH